MNKEESLIFCASGCGNNMHIECALHWIEHKVSQDQRITCPLCRCEWNDEFHKYVEEQAKINRKKALLAQQQKMREETKKKELEQKQNENPKYTNKTAIINEMMEKAKENPFGIEGHNFKSNQNTEQLKIGGSEEDKSQIKISELYKRKPPRDIKIRKNAVKQRIQPKSNIKQKIAKQLSSPAEKNPLEIAGLHLGTIPDQENYNHEQEPLILPQLVVKTKQKIRRKSNKVLMTENKVSLINTGLELTGQKFGYNHYKAPQSADNNLIEF